MHAIVSLLEPTKYQLVENLWKKLEAECGLHGNKITPYPHLSWQVAEDYHTELLANRLARIAARSKPITVRSSGLGLFTGPEPVFFINTVKDNAMIRFHERLLRVANEYAVVPSRYYEPDLWMPHITLAHRGLTAETLNCAMKDLAFQDFHWEIHLDNLALVCQEGDEIGRLIYRWDFPAARMAG